MNSTALKTIFAAGLAAGFLDILAALLMNVVIKAQTTTTKLLQSIASGVLGKSAYEGGAGTAALGLLFHFIIATIFAAIFVFIYPYLKLARTRPVMTGIAYGLIVWSIMNLIVLPIAFSRAVKFNLSNSWQGILIIVLCVGLPIALITRKHLGLVSRQSV